MQCSAPAARKDLVVIVLVVLVLALVVVLVLALIVVLVLALILVVLVLVLVLVAAVLAVLAVLRIVGVVVLIVVHFFPHILPPSAALLPESPSPCDSGKRGLRGSGKRKSQAVPYFQLQQ